MEKIFFSSIGQDSHRIDDHGNKPLILGGVLFNEDFSLEANSDGDVILHALTNAISGATTHNILGKRADEMCNAGIMDSKEYVKAALKYMENIEIMHVSISIEALRPKFSPKIEEMRKSIAELLNLTKNAVGITATTGERLTECGQGKGIFVTIILSCCKES